jgi:hypothetical protein
MWSVAGGIVIAAPSASGVVGISDIYKRRLDRHTFRMPHLDV